MYVVCDCMKPLSEAFFFRDSFIGSILKFASVFPGIDSLVIYRDLRGRCELSDLQYIATLDRKSIITIKNKYLYIDQNK